MARPSGGATGSPANGWDSIKDSNPYLPSKDKEESMAPAWYEGQPEQEEAPVGGDEPSDDDDIYSQLFDPNPVFDEALPGPGPSAAPPQRVAKTKKTTKRSKQRDGPPKALPKQRATGAGPIATCEHPLPGEYVYWQPLGSSLRSYVIGGSATGSSSGSAGNHQQHQQQKAKAEK
jgi:hypothetical protein